MDDRKNALSIVSALANGVNPLTGEIFPADSPYQSPGVVRALFTAARALESSDVKAPAVAAERAAAAKGPASNVGKPWSPEDDRRLLAEFDGGCRPAELAKLLGRTLAGIEARLEKHGRLDPNQRQTSNRYPRNANGAGAP